MTNDSTNNQEVELIIARLQECIDKSNMTFIELEKASGIPKSNIQRYVSGNTKKIPVSAIQALAKATGISAAYIMGWEDNHKELNRSVFDDPDHILEKYYSLDMEDRLEVRGIIKYKLTDKKYQKKENLA